MQANNDYSRSSTETNPDARMPPASEFPWINESETAAAAESSTTAQPPSAASEDNFVSTLDMEAIKRSPSSSMMHLPTTALVRRPSTAGTASSGGNQWSHNKDETESESDSDSGSEDDSCSSSSSSSSSDEEEEEEESSNNESDSGFKHKPDSVEVFNNLKSGHQVTNNDGERTTGKEFFEASVYAAASSKALCQQESSKPVVKQSNRSSITKRSWPQTPTKGKTKAERKWNHSLEKVRHQPADSDREKELN